MDKSGNDFWLQPLKKYGELERMNNLISVAATMSLLFRNAQKEILNEQVDGPSLNTLPTIVHGQGFPYYNLANPTERTPLAATWGCAVFLQ